MTAATDRGASLNSLDSAQIPAQGSAEANDQKWDGQDEQKEVDPI